MPRNRNRNKKVKKQVRREVQREFNLPVKAPRPKRPKSNLPMRQPRGGLRDDLLGVFKRHGPEYANMALNTARSFITGFGDYKINKNSLMDGNIPQIRNSNLGKAGISITHCEYLGDLSSTSAFTVSSYPLNPGISATFPWLSSLAVSFEEYVIDGMIFELKSTSSNAVLSTNASSALGTMVVATRYDALDPVFSNKMEMLNYEFGNSCDPSKNLIHPIECSYAQTTIPHRYIRVGGIPANADLRLYDYGTTDVATVGMQSIGGAVAEIWISYQIRLFKPKLIASSDAVTSFAAHYQLLAPTAAAPFGTPPGTKIFDSIGVAIASGTTILIIPTSPGRKFFMMWTVTGGSVATVGPTVSFNNATGVNTFVNQTVSSKGAGGTGTVMIIVSTFVATSTATITVTYGVGGTLPTAITSSDLMVFIIPDDFILKNSLPEFDLLMDATEPRDDDVEEESDVLDEDFYHKLRLLMKKQPTL